MKKHSSLNKKNLTIILVIVGVVIIAAVAFWLITSRHDPTSQYHPKYSTPSASSGGSSVSTPQVENDSKNSDQTASDTTSQQVPVAPSGSVAIVDLSQADGYINAKATVSGFTTTQCVYTFTAQDARPVIRQINGDCTGVSIPQGEFELIGTYTLTVTAYNGTTEKVTASKDISVQ